MKHLLKTLQDIFTDKKERNAFFMYMLIYFGIWITAMSALRLTPLNNGKVGSTIVMHIIATVTGLIMFLLSELIEKHKRKDDSHT